MPSRNTSKNPILLLGAYGRGNAGDDMFLTSALQLFPNYDIYINSADDNKLPPNVRSRIQTISTTRPTDVLRKISIFLKIKSAVYWGGDLWVQLYGASFPRQLLYKMIILNCLLRVTGKKIYYIGCGIGPLTGYSLWLARLSAKMAHLIVVREQRSANILNLPQIKLLPDLAINVPYYKPIIHTRPAGKQPFVIGLSLLQALPDPDENFPVYIDKISAFLNALPKGKFRVVLFPMHVSPQHSKDDSWTSEQLISQLRNINTETFPCDDLEKTIKKMGECNLMIGTRLHANILSTLNATPCLGISYRPKVKAFFEANNLGQYCLDLNKLDGLNEVFWEIYTNYELVAQAFLRASKQNLSKRAVYAQLVKQVDQ